MRGVGRSGHSRRLQNFVRQAGGYANPVSSLHNVLRERATENDTTVDLPGSPRLRGEATWAAGNYKHLRLTRIVAATFVALKHQTDWPCLVCVAHRH